MQGATAAKAAIMGVSGLWAVGSVSVGYYTVMLVPGFVGLFLTAVNFLAALVALAVAWERPFPAAVLVGGGMALTVVIMLVGLLVWGQGVSVTFAVTAGVLAGVSAVLMVGGWFTERYYPPRKQAFRHAWESYRQIWSDA